MTSLAVSGLTDALKSEFEDEVVFLGYLPTTVTAPGVFVTPGDPFLEPGTHGGIAEVWNVMVAVSVKEPGPGIDLLRELSLRVARVVQSQGAVWRRATGLRRPMNPENSQIVLSLNEVAFRYPNPE